MPSFYQVIEHRSEELIKKLEKQTSKENAKQLQRQVFIYNRIKAGNDAIYANVDAIHSAIYDNKQICFKYCEWTVKKAITYMMKLRSAPVLDDYALFAEEDPA